MWKNRFLGIIAHIQQKDSKWFVNKNVRLSDFVFNREEKKSKGRREKDKKEIKNFWAILIYFSGCLNYTKLYKTEMHRL